MRPVAIESADQGPNDAEIAARVTQGDAEAFRLLMRRHNQMLYRAARSILKDDAEAEDAVQDGYMRAYGAIGSFRGDSKLSTWLTRIVVNEALGRARKRSRSAEIIRMDGNVDQDIEAAEVNSDEKHSGEPEHAALGAETRRLIERKIDSLPDAFRAVFVMRALEELTVEETAAVLDIPEGTVRTRFFRARALLRDALAREIDFALEDAFAFAGDRCDRIVAGVLARIGTSRASGA